MSATICFCHGRESGPWGTKIRRLASVVERFGGRVISPDDRDTQDPDERVRRLTALAVDLPGPLILVGSSMGGYVAAVAARQLQPLGLFLLAPAIGIPGYAVSDPDPATPRLSIVHGWDDEVVPVENILRFAAARRAELHLLHDGHILHHELDRIERLFTDFLAGCLGRTRPAIPARELVAAL